MPPAAPRTDPAHKYGPTQLYGDCEHDSCSTKARSTCPECKGHFCLAHAAHGVGHGNGSDA